MASISQHSWLSFHHCATVTSISPNLKISTSVASANPNPRALKPLKISSFLSEPNAGSSPPSSSNPMESKSDAEAAGLDPVKLASAKAKAYKKSKSPSPGIVENPSMDSEGNDGNGNGYGKSASVSSNDLNKETVADGSQNGEEGKTSSGLNGNGEGNLGDGYGVKRVGSKEEVAVSRIDFVGLNFSDSKRGRGLPAGLVPVDDPFPEGDLPEVELIVGDSSKFGTSMPLVTDQVQEDNLDFYKPKVSTWGVFPRPSNISKTFGGGRVIRPGEVLETAEDKAVKKANTRKLLATYRQKVGLNIDPVLKSECEKALNDGDSLMKLGKLKDALPYYEQVMERLAFQSELHGLAALQWSICQDSLSRLNEARAMYERLLSHPNVQVSKNAKKLIFGFEAMEMMNVKSSSANSKASGYQNFFDAFIEDKMSNPIGEAEVAEGALNQAILYIVLLISPIFVVLLLAFNK